MHDEEHVQGHGGTGPPSARARQQLSADLRRELADARVRLQEASLRAEAHRLLGDPAAAADALREQRALLGDLEHRLGRSLSAAVLQREAEDVVAAVEEPVVVPSAAPRRRPILSGVASLAVAVALGSLAILGQGPESVTVLDVSDEADLGDTATHGDDPAADPTGQQGSAVDRSSTHAPDTGAPASDRDTGATPEDSSGRDTTGGGQDDGTTDPDGDDVDDLVNQLDAVVDSLDSVDVPAELPSEEPSSEVSTDDVEPEVPDDENPPTPAANGDVDDADDGFVPATGAH